MIFTSHLYHCSLTVDCLGAFHSFQRLSSQENALNCLNQNTLQASGATSVSANHNPKRADTSVEVINITMIPIWVQILSNTFFQTSQLILSLSPSPLSLALIKRRL